MSTVRTGRQGKIFIVIIDRPGVRNAVDASTASALADAFRGFDADDDVYVAILTGSGGTFCAGYDLKSVAARVHSYRRTATARWGRPGCCSASQ